MTGSPPLPVDDAPATTRHRLTMTLLMTPEMSNFAGNVHGGQILRLLDQVAYTCASRYVRGYVVTLSVDRVVFRAPIHVGELVTFAASVNRTGTTSLEVGIRVTTEDVRTGRTRHTNSSYFTLVAVDENLRPTKVPVFTPSDATERRRRGDAERRRRS